MGGSKISSWIGGTAVAALLLVVAAWFLLISPVMASASDTKAEAQSQRDANENLQDKIDILKKQAADLPKYKKELAGLQTQVPTDANVAAYLRELDAVAEKHKVTITVVTPTGGQPFVPVAPPAQDTTMGGAGVSDADATAEGSETSSDTASSDEAAANGAPEGMVDVAVNLTAVGSYDDILAFVDDVQRGTKRLMLVTNVTGTGQDDAEASGGRPKTSVGDLEVSISGMLYVLPVEPTTVSPADAPATPEKLPAAVKGKNPLAPVAGK